MARLVPVRTSPARGGESPAGERLDAEPPDLPRRGLTLEEQELISGPSNTSQDERLDEMRMNAPPSMREPSFWSFGGPSRRVERRPFDAADEFELNRDWIRR